MNIEQLQSPHPLQDLTSDKRRNIDASGSVTSDSTNNRCSTSSDTIELQSVQLRDKTQLCGKTRDSIPRNFELTVRSSTGSDDDLERFRMKPILISNRPGARSSVQIQKTVRFIISADDTVKRPHLNSELNEDDLNFLECNMHAMNEISKRARKFPKKEASERCCTDSLLTTSLSFVLLVVVICLIAIQYTKVVEKSRLVSTRGQLPPITKRTLSTFDQMMPGVTLCTSNVIDRSKLNQLPELISKFKSLQYYRRGMQLEQEKEKVIKHYVENLSVQKFSTLSPSSANFVNQIYCDTSKWVRSDERYSMSESCANMYRIRSVEKSGTCFTLFHFAAQFAAQTYASRDEDNYDDREQIYFMLGIPRKERQFDSRQLFEVNVNFESLNYADKALAISGKVLLHSNRITPSISDAGHVIEPGYSYHFYIRKQSYHRASNCKNYAKDYTAASKREGWPINLRVPLSREACIEQCVIKTVLEKCRCWPSYVPFFRDNQTITGGSSVYYCGSLLSTVCGHAATSRSCASKCPPDCTDEAYDVQVTRAKDPSDEKLDSLRVSLAAATNGSDEFEQLDNELNILLDDQKNKANVKLSYATFDELVTRESLATRGDSNSRGMECEQLVLIGLIIIIVIAAALLLNQLRKNITLCCRKVRS